MTTAVKLGPIISLELHVSYHSFECFPFNSTVRKSRGEEYIYIERRCRVVAKFLQHKLSALQ